MDLSRYELKDLILTALKSEVTAEGVYLKVMEQVKNFFLRDRLKFLADEERKHAAFFRDYFNRRFPGETIVLPEVSPVPLPEMKIERETIPISEVMAMGMKTEMAAYEFYTGLAERLPADDDIPDPDTDEPAHSTREMVLYIASMEMGHYRLLEIEERNALEQEQYEIVWNMTHLGP